MAVPYTFGNATTSIPLSQLDSNFATAITIGNTAVYLGNTTTSFGNVTLTNVTISSGNATVTKVTTPTVDAGSGNALTLQSNSTTALYIDTSQNVGIGTTSPDAPLTVQRASYFPQMDFKRTGIGAWYVGGDNVGTDNNFHINLNANTNFFTIDTGGLVGIGTSSPNSKLDVRGNITLASNTMLGSLSGTTTGALNLSGGNAFAGGSGGAIVLRGYTNGYNNGGLEFYYGNGSATNEAMRIDSSGNVGIGTTAPATPLCLGNSKTLGWLNASGALNGTTTGTQILKFSDNNLYIDNLDASTNIIFRRNGPTESMRIDSSGNLLVGTTSGAWIGKLSVASDSSGAYYPFALNNTASGSTSYPVVDIYRAGTRTGTISNTNTATAYNTSSDYRLKENVQPMTTGLATIVALKPVTYDWIIDKSKGEGFIAHELQEVVPLAVTGEKDAVDENGNINPQGVDYSKIVVHLVSAVQQLKAELDALKGTK